MAYRIPNLFLVGAMRSGTTALHEVLGSHPAIFMSDVKEPAYFTDPEELATDSRVSARAGFAGNRAAYLELFAAAGDAKYVGESSTHYTKQPRINGVVGRMAAECDDPRIVYLIRDPVARAISHYRYHVRAKYERRPILEALRTEPIYTATSNYPMQIEPFLDRFGQDRIRIVVLEELTAQPEVALGSLLSGLDVDLDTIELRLPQRNEVAGPIVRARGPEALHELGRSSGYQRVARTVIPRSMRKWVRRTLNRPVPNDETVDPAVLHHLRTVHADHVAATEALLGRSLDRWTTFDPSRTGT